MQISILSKGINSRADRSGTNGGYKTWMMDISKFRDYNCNDLGHFTSECKQPK